MVVFSEQSRVEFMNNTDDEWRLFFCIVFHACPPGMFTNVLGNVQSRKVHLVVCSWADSREEFLIHHLYWTWWQNQKNRKFRKGSADDEFEFLWVLFFSRISTNIIVFIRLIHSTLICCNDENNQQKNLFIFWAWTPKKEPIKISQCTVSPNIYSCVAAKSPVRNGWNPHIWTEISNAVVI